MKVSLFLSLTSAFFLLSCSKKSGEFKGDNANVNAEEANAGTVIADEGPGAIQPEASPEETASAEIPAGEENPADVMAAQEPVDYGVKNGHQVYNSLLAVTGVTESQAIRDYYLTVETGLAPFSNQLIDLTSGHVANIFKLSTEICDAMMQEGLGATFFQGCNLALAPNNLGAADKTCLAEQAAQNFWGTTKDANTLVTMIDTVIPDLAANPNANTVATLTCANAASALQSLIY